MCYLIRKSTITATFIVAISAFCALASQGQKLVVEPTTALPQSAREPAAAMHLYQTGDGKTILYLEQNEGKTLTLLDVTDPASIREISKVSLESKGPFDFVEDFGSSTLIRYRDQSAWGILSFRNYRHPVVKTVRQGNVASIVEKLGETEFLLKLGSASPSPKLDAVDYQLVELSHPELVLATIPGVRQRIYSQETGTLFLLTGSGAHRHPSPF